MFSTVPRTDTTVRIYTCNEPVLLETSITEFHGKFYIPEIQKMEFHLAHALILGTHHYGKEFRKAFKRRLDLHGVLCRCYYAEWVVSSFAHQIQSK